MAKGLKPRSAKRRHAIRPPIFPATSEDSAAWELCEDFGVCPERLRHVFTQFLPSSHESLMRELRHEAWFLTSTDNRTADDLIAWPADAEKSVQELLEFVESELVVGDCFSSLANSSAYESAWRYSLGYLADLAKAEKIDSKSVLDFTKQCPGINARESLVRLKIWLLAQNSSNDTPSSTEPIATTATFVAMTEPLTKAEIAGYFSVGRNKSVDEIIKKYNAEEVCGKFRFPLSVMTPKYHAKAKS